MLLCVTVRLFAVLSLVQTPIIPPGDIDPTLLQPPRTMQDVASRRALAESRLAFLRPASQAADANAASPDALLTAEWEAYLMALDRFEAMQAEVQRRSSDEFVQSHGGRVESLRAAAAQPSPATAPADVDAALQDVTRTLEQHQAELNALSESQAQRAATLAGGLRAAREAVQAELDAAQGRRRALAAPVSGAAASRPTADDDPSRRILDVAIARHELRLATLPLQLQQAELAHRQDAQTIEALRGYVTTLRRRAAALSEARGRSAIESIEQQQGQALDPTEQALLDLRHFVERARVSWFENAAVMSAFREGFTKAALERLRERLATAEALWNETVSALAGRSGRDLARLRRDLDEARSDLNRQRREFESRHGRIVKSMHALHDVRERASDRFRHLEQRAIQVAAAAAPDVRARIERDAAQLRSDFNESMRAAVDDARQLSARQAEAIALIDEQAASLDRMDDELYWAAILSRGSGFAGQDWDAVRREWSELVSPASAGAAAPGSARAIHTAINGSDADWLGSTASNVRADLIDAFEARRSDLARPGRRGAAIGAVVMALAMLMGWMIRRHAVARAREIRESWSAVRAPTDRIASADDVPRLGARLAWLGWRMTGDTVIPVAGVAAVQLVLWIEAIPSRTRAPMLLWFAVLLVAWSAVVLVRRMVEAGPEGMRVTPCAAATARHYRRWAAMAGAWFALTVSVGIVLSATASAPALLSLVRAAGTTVILLMLLAFLARRRRVLGFDLPARHAWIGAVALRIHTLVVLAVAGLIGLEIAGFGMLVEYVLIGAATTIAIAGLIGAGVEYGVDRIEQWPARDRAPRRRAAALTPGDNGHKAVAGSSTGPPSPSPVPAALGARLLRSAVRLMGLTAALLGILAVWGVPIRRMAFDATLLIWIAVIVATALLVDRLLVTALHALQLAGRLAESTGNIVRRWARGVLVLIVGGAIGAAAGYEINSLWTPLSTLLAMVAIGFVAMWSLLSNILATLMILIWRPFNIGETIDIQPDGVGGRVIDINFMFTLLAAEDGGRVSVPNALFIQKFVKRRKIINRPTRSLAEQLAAEEPLFKA